MKSLFISLFIGSKEFCNSPLSANTPPCNKQSASRAFSFAKFLSTLLLVLLSVGDVWGDVPTLDDLDFGTPIVDENFNRLSTTSSTTMQTPAADLSGFGAFNKVYNGDGLNSYAVAKDVINTSFLSNCLALTQGSGSRLNVSIDPSPLSIGSVGAWRIKTTKTSRSQYGINTDMGGGISHSTARVYIQNLEGVISISDGSSWQSISTVNSDIIDICVIYNKSGGETTYGGGISISNNKAHVFINGVCVMYNGNPKAFTISSSSLDNAVFRVVPSATSGYKSYVDDVQIWNSLPTAKTAHTQTYSVTLKDKDEVLTETSCDGGVTLPTREEEGFLGWSVDDCGESWLAVNVPYLTKIIPAGTYYPSQETALYPVYTSGVFSAYKAVTPPDDDWTGIYLIGDNKPRSATGAMDGSYLGIDGIDPATATIEITSREFTLSKTGNYYHIQFSDGDYLTKSGTATLAKIAAGSLTNIDSEKWIPSSEKIVSAAATDRYIGYNDSKYKAYTSGTKAVLYRRIESYRSLSSCTQHNISLSGVPAGTLTGGTIEASRSSACEGTTITITATPADSYEFVEWTINKEGGGTVTPISSTSSSTTFTMPDVNVTINATFSTSAFEITLHDNNGGDNNGSATVGEGDNTLTIVSNPIRTGYTIEGYYTNAACTTKVATPAGELQNGGGEGIEGWTNDEGEYIKGAGGTLYTNWSANTYTITLNGNSGTGHTASVSATYNSATIDAIANPTRTGYSFNGWYSGEGGTGTLIIDTEGVLQANSIYTGAGGIWTNDGNVTLYAKWTAMTSHITFYDGESPISSGTTEMDNTFDQVPEAITCPTKDGYIFAGYQTSNSVQLIGADGVWSYPGENSYLRSNNTWKSISGNVSLYAIWVTAYHVSWMVDGNEIHSEEVAEGTKVTSMPDNPTSLHPRIDKVFVGWRSEAIDGVSETDDTFYTIDGSPIVDEDFTFYAVFGDQKESSVNAGTIIWSEDFTGCELNSKPSSPGPSATVYTGTISYNCVDVSNELVTDVRAGSHAGGTTPELRIAYADGDNHGKFIVSGLSSVGASELELSYKQNNYALNVYITAGGEDIPIASGSSGGSYTISCDSRFESTFSLTFEDVRSGVYNYVRIDDIVLRVKRPSFEHLVTNSYHNDLSSDAPSPVAMSWSTASWQKGVLPTIEDTVVLSNIAMTIDVIDAKAKQIILEDNATLTIAAGKALAVATGIRKTDDGAILSGATQEDDIFIASDGTNGTGALTVGEESTETKATVQFYTKAKKISDVAENRNINQYFGIPVERTSALAYYGAYLYHFNVEAFRWDNIGSGVSMDAFDAYNIKRNETTETTFEIGGTLNLPGTTEHKEKRLTLYRDPADYADTDLYGNRYNTTNMFANSWSAPIDITAFDVENDFVNAEATIYIFTAGTQTQAESQSTGANKYSNPGQWLVLPVSSVKDYPRSYLTIIPSQQAFLVKATGDPGEVGYASYINLDYERLVYTPIVTSGATIEPTRAPRRSAQEKEEMPMETMQIRVQGESGYGDRVMMHIREDFSTAYENGYDGKKMFDSPAMPYLYALTGYGPTAVNCVPTAEGTVIAFEPGNRDNLFAFTFDYDGEEVWYLNDLVERKSTRIINDNTYPFYMYEGEEASRFVISATPISKTPTELEEGSDGKDAKAKKVMVNGTLYILRAGRVYDATGAMVK